MSKHSLKDDIVRYLTNKNSWVSKGEITQMIWWYPHCKKQYLPETVGRKLRIAEQQSRIAVKQDGTSVQYKFLPVEKRSLYIPFSQRTDQNVLFKMSKYDR